MQNLPQDWEVKTLGECLEYEQPTKYIVKNTQYSDEYKIPVLTAGKSFLLGYTNDTENIFTQTPVIIFDDFTTDSKFVDFDFKVKSSAMKILHTTKIANIKFVFYFMQTIQYRSDTHKRYWISEYAKLPIPLPPLETQKAIVEKLENAFTHIDEAVRHLKAVQTNIPRLKSSLLYSAFSGKLTESQITTPTSTLSFSQRKSNPSPLPLTKEMLPFFCTKGEPAHSPLLAKNRAGGTTAPAFSDFSHHEVGAESHYNYHSKALAKESKDNNTHTLPKNWEVKTLGEVCEFVYGKALNQTKRKTNGKYPVYAANGIKDYSDEFMISKNSIIVGRKGSVGSIVLTSSPCWVLDVAYYVNFDEENYNLVFLYHLLKYLNLKQFARGVKPGISRSQIYELQVVMPPLETQKQIVQILESKFAHLEKLAQFVNASLENLQRLKSSLLNQAFKGELIC